MENIQQVAKPSAMMNEAPMNHLTLSDRLKSYKRTPGSFLVMLLVVLSAVATIAALVSVGMGRFSDGNHSAHPAGISGYEA